MELIELSRLGDMELITQWYPQGIASKSKEDAARRDEQITELLSYVRDNPARIYNLLQLQDYGLADQQDFYFELRSLLTEALDQIDNSGEHLLEAALSQDVAWYVRRQAVYLLKARRQNAIIFRLMPLLEEHGLQGEIRAAVATALGQQQIEEARPLLQNLYRAQKKGNDPRLAGWTYAEADLLEALGFLGERDTLRPLMALQYHPYQSRRMSGQRGLSQLIRHLGGLPGVLDLLDHGVSAPAETRLARLATSDPAESVRRWATEQLASFDTESAIKVICDRLEDTSWMVANAAAQKLIILPQPPIARLRAISQDTATIPSKRLWATYALLKLNQSLPDGLLGSIPGYPLVLPPMISPALRKAILQCWAQNSEPGTDVNWLVESQTLPPFQPYEVPFEPLRAELAKRGLTVGRSLHCAELYKQGRGTFWVLQSRTAYNGKLYFYTLYLTLLGPFAHLNVLTSDDETANIAEIPFNQVTPEETRRIYREAVEAVGLNWLENSVTSYIFPGLNVYYFGNREALSVNDLLYYWQD